MSAARATFPTSCSARSPRTKPCSRIPSWLSDILTHAIPADGVGVWINGNYAFSGLTPSEPAFARIIKALHATAAGRVFATDRISSLVPEALEHASQAAGMLAIPISRSPRDYVVLFRSEVVRSVRWAGDPHKPVEYGPNGPRLTPRAKLRGMEGTGRGQLDPVHRVGIARRRNASRHPDRSRPAPRRRGQRRAPGLERAAGTADRRAQPPRAQYPQPHSRPDPPVEALGGHLDRGFRGDDRRAHPRARPRP